ncbi:hypothetical protein Pmani_036866, partial [Petrolisthes manimaculis]
VEVRIPAFISSASNYLEGLVVANYTSSGAPVSGNVTVRAAVVPLGPRPFKHHTSGTRDYAAIAQPHAMVGAGGMKGWLKELMEDWVRRLMEEWVR